MLRGSATDLNFRLILVGTEAGGDVIRDLAGNNLDGDNNGEPGGDYWTSFTSVG